MPCSFITSVSRQVASFFSDVIPALSSARFAGALSDAMKCESFSRTFSHLGQVGQSLLLLYLWPFGQVRTVPLRFAIAAFSNTLLTPAATKSRLFSGAFDALNRLARRHTLGRVLGN
jgi:hypothetical protein